jgi:hypothetical protein
MRWEVFVFLGVVPSPCREEQRAILPANGGCGTGLLQRRSKGVYVALEPAHVKSVGVGVGFGFGGGFGGA